MIHGDGADPPAASTEASQTRFKLFLMNVRKQICWNTSITNIAEKQLCSVGMAAFKGRQAVITGSY